MNFVRVSFAMMVLYQCLTTKAEITPVEWSATFSEECGEYSSLDVTAALTTLTQMLLDNKTSASLPKSWMEIKERSSLSPSGYYTISNGTSGNAAVVYCNMDDLYSCPALEQTLSGIRKDVDSLFAHIDSPLLSSSCSEVKERCPQCKSGVYEIVLDPNNVNFVYCTLENSTYCNVTGPWTKLASWDIAELGSNCSSELQLFVNGTVYACGIPEGSISHGCLSLPRFLSPVPYTMVCGKMRGYQKGSDDSFGPNYLTINDPYVDGVSITRGTPRQHVWTYAIGVEEKMGTYSFNRCPCNTGTLESSLAFVASDYFCESGCPGTFDHTTFHAADPLWDGEGCGGLETVCCSVPGQPWFHKVLDAPTTDYIEIRLCIDEDTSNENVLISSYEIYVL